MNMTKARKVQDLLNQPDRLNLKHESVKTSEGRVTVMFENAEFKTPVANDLLDKSVGDLKGAVLTYLEQQIAEVQSALAEAGVTPDKDRA